MVQSIKKIIFDMQMYEFRYFSDKTRTSLTLLLNVYIYILHQWVQTKNIVGAELR